MRLDHLLSRENYLLFGFEGSFLQNCTLKTTYILWYDIIYFLNVINKDDNLIKKYQTVTGQVIKGAGRMPWHWEPMKDVVSCDKLWGVARKLWSIDFRMRKLTMSNVMVSSSEYIARWGELGELKHLSTRRKRKKFDSASSGERTRNSPNLRSSLLRGCGHIIRKRLLQTKSFGKLRHRR